MGSWKACSSPHSRAPAVRWYGSCPPQYIIPGMESGGSNAVAAHNGLDLLVHDGKLLQVLPPRAACNRDALRASDSATIPESVNVLQSSQI